MMEVDRRKEVPEVPEEIHLEHNHGHHLVETTEEDSVLEDLVVLGEVLEEQEDASARRHLEMVLIPEVPASASQLEEVPRSSLILVQVPRSPKIEAGSIP